MNPSDKDVQAEQQKLSELYHRLKYEQPSAEVDERILHLARQHGALNNTAVKQHSGSQHTSASKVKYTWRRWQWPLSIAASVIFVSVIFIRQFALFSPESEVLIPQDMTDFAMSSPKASVQADIASQALEMSQYPATIRSLNEDLQPETEKLVLQTKQEKQRAEQQSVVSQAEQQKQMRLADTKQAEKLKEMHAVAEVSQAKLSRLKIAQLQQQLTIKQTQLAFLQKHQKGEANQDSFTANTIARLSLKNLKLQELKMEIVRSQNQLFSHMQAYFQEDPHWQASEQLLNQLRLDQQLNWHQLTMPKQAP